MATIDTLGIAKRWREAKTEEERAEVLANSLRELQQVQLDQFATKRDLDVLFWRMIAAVAVLLLGHLGAVWAIVASVAGGSS